LQQISDDSVQCIMLINNMPLPGHWRMGAEELQVCWEQTDASMPSAASADAVEVVV